MTQESNTIISVQDYGPIAEAKNVELCPLTVFVGPSNTGKSYLATLVYALYKSFESDDMFRRHARRLMWSQRRDHANQTNILTGENTGWLEKALNEDTKNLSSLDFPKEIKEWIDVEASKIISENFHQEISRCMGVHQEENDVMGKEFKLTLEDNLKKIVLNPLHMTSSMKIKRLSMESRELRRFRRYVVDGGRMPIDMQIEILFSAMSDQILRPYRRSESFYLPAGRTGIMQSHRAIVGALVQRATYAGLEDVSVPTLGGVLADFLQKIIQIDTGRRKDLNVARVAETMEKKILYGSITQGRVGINQYPRFAYKQNDIEVPLLRASSMVSELAPVVLFLRNRIKKGDLIIIEEPESHLHPAAQRKITETIVQLVRAGVRVMVTTHSDYILEQLSNWVRRSKLSDKSETSLDEKEIGAYSFTPKPRGTVVKRLQFTNENGISPDDHDQVSSDLYNETVGILDQIDAEKE